MFIRCESLGKWYGQVIALNDLDFRSDVPILGLLGPNGAGKTSLLKLMAGLLRPSRGEVFVFGQRPWNNPNLLASLGFCPDGHALPGALSARQWIATLLRLSGHGFSEARTMAERALELLGIAGLSDRPLGSLSRGQRQRVKLAQSIAHRPRWLLLDEPFSGMDPPSRSAAMELVRQMAEGGCRIVISSHVLYELEAVTSDILLLHRGRLLAQGQVEQIRALLDEHPLKVMLESPDARALAARLIERGCVQGVRVMDGRIVAETDRPDEFYDMVGRMAGQGEFEVTAMVTLDDNLAAVFEYLVE